MKTNTFMRGVAGGVIALLLVGITLPTPRAQAVTLAELQAKIQDLLNQVAALQVQLQLLQEGSFGCVVPAPDLTIGSRGSEVVALQNFLIDRGYSIPAGATGYFGNQTEYALRLFQANQGISPALGYYGPQTHARIQSLCTTAPPPPEPEAEPQLGGEASFDRFTVKDGDDTDIEEGDEAAKVMEISFRVRDGDAELSRIRLGFTPDIANDEDEPWDTFDEVSVWSGNEEIAVVDASDEDNWNEDSPRDGDYLLRLSSIDWIMQEDQEIELVTKLDVQNSVRGTDDGEVWNVFIPDNGLRALDADNAAIYIGDTADSVSLNLDRAGASDELIVRRSDDDPDSSSLQLEDNRSSGYLEVFAFDLDTDDSRNDIEIIELPVKLTVSTSTIETFVKDVRLIANGDTFTQEVITDGATGLATFEFDRDEFVIDAGDRITVMVEVRFRSLPEKYEGTTLVGRVDASDIEAEGRDDLIGGQLVSNATGELHTLYTKGVSATSESASAEVTSVDGAANDYVTFGLSVEVTAFGQDVYIPIGTGGVTYQLQDSLGNALSASGTAVVTSSARERDGYFHIPEGSTESVTLDVTYVPGVPHTTARMQLVSINFNDTASPPDQTWLALPATDYRTPTRIIVN